MLACLYRIFMMPQSPLQLQLRSFQTKLTIKSVQKSAQRQKTNILTSCCSGLYWHLHGQIQIRSLTAFLMHGTYAKLGISWTLYNKKIRQLRAANAATWAPSIHHLHCLVNKPSSTLRPYTQSNPPPAMFPKGKVTVWNSIYSSTASNSTAKGLTSAATTKGLVKGPAVAHDLSDAISTWTP